MKAYYILTLGCQMNEADSEQIAGWYEKRGWQKARKAELADEIVINSCSVRQTAEDRVYGQVNKFSKFKAKKPKLILTGCMLRYPLRLLKEKLPHVDEFKKIGDYQAGEKVRKSTTHAYVPIMEGCNNYCSYCVVPFARGREVSRLFKEIVCEVEALAERGFSEITLLGQNVNSYSSGFARLLKALHEVKGVKKISFLTSNPWDLDDQIIKAMSLPKIDRYLHLPVQSGDDEILKRMNRKYTAADYLALIKKIRQQIPEIQIGTDIIVGFPGETKDQFQNTVRLCKEVNFTKAYVAMYSPRIQTTAFKMKDNVPHREKRKRWRQMDEMINVKKMVNSKG